VSFESHTSFRERGRNKMSKVVTSQETRRVKERVLKKENLTHTHTYTKKDTTRFGTRFGADVSGASCDRQITHRTVATEVCSSFDVLPKRKTGFRQRRLIFLNPTSLPPKCTVTILFRIIEIDHRGILLFPMKNLFSLWENDLSCYLYVNVNQRRRNFTVSEETVVHLHIHKTPIGLIHIYFYLFH